MIGTKFSRWTVIDKAEPQSFPSKKNVTRWLCQCACGTVRAVTQLSLKNGNSTSCGCFNKERTRQTMQTHGMTNTPEHTTWQSMRHRVRPSNSRSHDYSERGITVCERWDSFENFFEDMGPRPSDRHSIDRIDNNRGYDPSNCRWALPTEQMQNRRCTLKINVHGEDVPMSELARRCGIPANTLRGRIVEHGWDIERAMSTPVRPKARHRGK